uniref:Omp85 domain-containing protein n=1 Tax=Syphacia muris TaxID=451379 RepID=A0A0N5AUH6_9BILA
HLSKHQIWDQKKNLLSKSRGKLLRRGDESQLRSGGLYGDNAVDIATSWLDGDGSRFSAISQSGREFDVNMLRSNREDFSKVRIWAKRNVLLGNSHNFVSSISHQHATVQQLLNVYPKVSRNGYFKVHYFMESRDFPLKFSGQSIFSNPEVFRRTKEFEKTENLFYGLENSGKLLHRGGASFVQNGRLYRDNVINVAASLLGGDGGIFSGTSKSASELDVSMLRSRRNHFSKERTWVEKNALRGNSRNLVSSISHQHASVQQLLNVDPKMGGNGDLEVHYFMERHNFPLKLSGRSVFYSPQMVGKRKGFQKANKRFYLLGAGDRLLRQKDTVQLQNGSLYVDNAVDVAASWLAGGGSKLSGISPSASQLDLDMQRRHFSKPRTFSRKDNVVTESRNLVSFAGHRRTNEQQLLTIDDIVRKGKELSIGSFVTDPRSSDYRNVLVFGRGWSAAAPFSTCRSCLNVGSENFYQTRSYFIPKLYWFNLRPFSNFKFSGSSPYSYPVGLTVFPGSESSLLSRSNYFIVPLPVLKSIKVLGMVFTAESQMRKYFRVL